MENIIICGFSGIGKSWAAKCMENVIDMESSKYSKIKSEVEPDLLPPRENPLFPFNYADAIEKEFNEGHDKIILVSCHAQLRSELKKRGIPYLIILPYNTEEIKNEYKIRWFVRGSKIGFIKVMSDNWEEFIHSCAKDGAPCIYLEKEEFLVNILHRMFTVRFPDQFKHK